MIRTEQVIIFYVQLSRSYGLVKLRLMLDSFKLANQKWRWTLAMDS